MFQNLFKTRNNAFRYFDKIDRRRFDGGASAGAMALAAGISATAGLASAAIGSGVGSNGRRRSQRRAYLYNQALMQEQNQMNIENWQRENEYNLPTNVVQRLKDAGINPALYLNQNGANAGNAGSVASSQPGSMSAMPYEFNMPDLGDSIARGIKMAQDMSVFDEELKSRQLANEAKALENQYKDAFNKSEIPAMIAENALSEFNSKTQLNLQSLKEITEDDAGKPIGYHDFDGKYHAFNMFEKRVAEDMYTKMYDFQDYMFGRTAQNQAIAQSIDDIQQRGEALKLANDSTRENIKNARELTDAQKGYLSAHAAYLNAQQRSIDYELEQLKSSEENGVNVDIRMKKLQEKQQKLMNEAQEIQNEIDSRFGATSAVMKNILQPLLVAVGTGAGAFFGFAKMTRAAKTAGALNSAASGIRNVQRNPYVQPQTSMPFNQFAYP